MTYMVGLDSSTIHSAGFALDLLCDRRMQPTTSRLLAHLRALNVWSAAEPGRESDHFERLAEGLLRNGSVDSGKELALCLRVAFGLVCLSKLVEAICIADGVVCLGGTSAFIQLQRISRHIQQADSDCSQGERVWLSLSELVTSDVGTEYASWRQERNEDQEFCNFLEWTSREALPSPFINLGGHLFNVSLGLHHHPVGFDRIPPIPRLSISTISPEELGDRLGNGLLHQDDHVALSRLGGYLVNGLFHQRLCAATGVHYWWNPVRSPYMKAAREVRSYSDGDRFLTVLHGITHGSSLRANAEGGASGAAADGLPPLEHLLFSMVLAQAQSIGDILPVAYRIRKTLSPLRQRVGARGIDGSIDREIADELRLVDHWHKVRAREASALKFTFKPSRADVGVPLGGEYFAWLVKPYHLPQHAHLASIRNVRDQYRAAFSVAERIEKLHENAMSPGASSLPSGPWYQ